MKLNMKLVAVLVAMGISMQANAQQPANQDSSNIMGNSSMSQSMVKQRNFKGANDGIALAPVTNTQTVKYNYASCPGGFTYNGSTQYPINQQVTVTYYRSGQQIGQTVQPATDTDFDCTKTEQQNVSCPAGYTGNQVQRRLVSTGNGAYSYGNWNTWVSNCAAIPPVYGTESMVLGCPGGYTGSIVQQRSTTTTWDGQVSYGGWQTVQNTCTYTPPVNPAPSASPPYALNGWGTLGCDDIVTWTWIDAYHGKWVGKFSPNGKGKIGVLVNNRTQNWVYTNGQWVNDGTGTYTTIQVKYTSYCM